jgi:hypothetical protein
MSAAEEAIVIRASFSGVHSSIDTITPEIAAEWLTRNTLNRPQKPRKIAEYARDMAAGNWKMTGESIKFSRDGRLLDGQNRLLAIIAAQVSVRIMVITGLEPDTQDAMDAGARRSGSDQLHLHGKVNTIVMAAVISVMLGYQRGLLVRAGDDIRQTFTHAEILAFADATPLIDEAAMAAIRVRRLGLPTGVTGAAWLILHEVDPEECVQFFDDIAEYRTGGAGDPLSALIKRAGHDREQRKRVRPGEHLYMIIRVWNARRSGERLTKITTLTRGEWHAIPTPH